MTKSPQLGLGANRPWALTAARSVSVLGLLCWPKPDVATFDRHDSADQAGIENVACYK